MKQLSSGLRRDRLTAACRRPAAATLPDDFSPAKNVAEENPEKLAELQELFWQEAERNRALRLLAAFSVWLGDLPPLPTITRFTYAGDVQNVQTTMIPRNLRAVVRHRGGA